MTFEEFWKSVDELQRDIGYYSFDEYCLALFMEVAELTDNYRWAPWKKGKADRDNLMREIIDCMIFLHHIAHTQGITLDELLTKSKEVIAHSKDRYARN